MSSICYEIDLVALIEYETEGSIRFYAPSGTAHVVKGGPCPFCEQGTDRFAVYTEDTPQRYYCGIHSSTGGNGCGECGDAITFLRHYHDIGFEEAREKLFDFLLDYYKMDIDEAWKMLEPKEEVDSQIVSVVTGEESERLARIPKKRQGADQPPVKEWQEKAKQFCLESKEALKASEYQNALHWLTSTRGLSDHTIQADGLGYNPKTRWDDPAEWGITLPKKKKIWLPRGIVIPYQIDGHIWKTVIRRPEPDILADKLRYEKKGIEGGSPKYVEISGSSQGLYGANEIHPSLPLVLVEGPIDKLSFTQAVGDRVRCVATGGTGQSLEKKWVELVKQAPLVLVAFDDDIENGAGDSAAEFWLEAIPQSVRWAPWAHDINDMLVQGMDINAWVDVGIAFATEVLAPTPVPAPEPMPEPIHQDTSVQESNSSDDLPGESAEPFLCESCGLDLNTSDLGAYISDENEKPYCEKCWGRLGTSENITSPSFSERFLGHVNAIAEGLQRQTGEQWTVTLVPPGYTMAAHVAKLREQKLLPEPEREYSPSKFVPQSCCPAEEMLFTSKHKENSVKRRPCTGEPLENGWCAKHQPSLHVLQKGAALGYPRVQINSSLWVDAGKSHWEDLAIAISSQNLSRWMKALRSQKGAQ